MIRRFIPISAAVLAVTLAACAQGPDGDDLDAGSPPDYEDTTALGDGHGAIPGAQEVAEPQLHLLTIDQDGAARHLDLLDESVDTLSTIDGATELATEGRYGYAIRPDAGAVTVVDSGVWSWNHVDHFHYYRSDPSVLGDVRANGDFDAAAGVHATVSANDFGAGFFFPETGEAVMIAADTLGAGELDEAFRVAADPHDGLVVPIGNRALVTEPGPDGTAARVQALSSDGELLGDAADCADARGTITTVVGTVIGCSDGALLATTSDGGVEFEFIAYPDAGSAPRADEFRARKDRPTVAGVAGESGIWLLHTRNREWTLIDAGEPIVQAAAVDNAESHVVALTADGRVLVLSAKTRERLAATDPLVADSSADPQRRAGIALTVDQHRAYLNGPAENKLFEIDFADNARVARVFDTPAEPRLMVETGR